MAALLLHGQDWKAMDGYIFKSRLWRMHVHHRGLSIDNFLLDRRCCDCIYVPLHGLLYHGYSTSILVIRRGNTTPPRSQQGNGGRCVQPLALKRKFKGGNMRIPNRDLTISIVCGRHGHTHRAQQHRRKLLLDLGHHLLLFRPNNVHFRR